MTRKSRIIMLLVMLIAFPATAQEGLVGYWNFDNVSGDTLFDRSPFDNHGTNYGGEPVQGPKNNALAFDGNSSYARIPKNGEYPPEILKELGQGSISVWFKVDHILTEHGIAPIFYYGAWEKCDFFDAANQGLIIEVGHSPVHYKSKNIYFTIWKNGCTYPSFCFDSNSSISTGEWHHFVAVVGENYNTGYLDGQEMAYRRLECRKNRNPRFYIFSSIPA